MGLVKYLVASSFFFFFLHFMAGLHLQHMEVPEAKGQTEAVFVTATTMPDPSCI